MLREGELIDELLREGLTLREGENVLRGLLVEFIWRGVVVVDLGLTLRPPTVVRVLLGRCPPLKLPFWFMLLGVVRPASTFVGAVCMPRSICVVVLGACTRELLTLRLPSPRFWPRSRPVPL